MAADGVSCKWPGAGRRRSALRIARCRFDNRTHGSLESRSYYIPPPNSIWQSPTAGQLQLHRTTRVATAVRIGFPTDTALGRERATNITIRVHQSAECANVYPLHGNRAAGRMDGVPGRQFSLPASRRGYVYLPLSSEAECNLTGIKNSHSALPVATGWYGAPDHRARGRPSAALRARLLIMLNYWTILSGDDLLPSRR